MAQFFGRERRKKSIRHKIRGTSQRPRLSVFRSNQNIYVQIIDDDNGKTLVSCSTLEKDVKKDLKKTWDKESAFKIGQMVARKALEKNIKEVVFDRSGYKYHGRVKSVAEGARKGGLVF